MGAGQQHPPRREGGSSRSAARKAKWPAATAADAVGAAVRLDGCRQSAAEDQAVAAAAHKLVAQNVASPEKLVGSDPDPACPWERGSQTAQAVQGRRRSSSVACRLYRACQSEEC